jgi:hypothetical protein
MELQAPLLLSHARSAIELMGKSLHLQMEYLPTKAAIGGVLDPGAVDGGAAAVDGAAAAGLVSEAAHGARAGRRSASWRSGGRKKSGMWRRGGSSRRCVLRWWSPVRRARSAAGSAVESGSRSSGKWSPAAVQWRWCPIWIGNA